MARKKLNTFAAGEHITAEKMNNTFNTNGVEALVREVTGDQIKREGISNRVCNTGQRHAISTAPRGTGNPWFGGEAKSILNNPLLMADFFAQGTGAFIIRTGGDNMVLDLTQEVADTQEGDFALIEFCGQASFLHYLTGGAGASGQRIPYGPAGENGDYRHMTGRIYLRLTVNGIDYDIPSTAYPGCDAQFGSCYDNSDPTDTLSTGSIIGTFPDVPAWSGEGDFYNTGPGTHRSFHLSLLVPLTGNESTLYCKAVVAPYSPPENTTPAPGPTQIPYADPIANISQAFFSGRIIRKGEIL